MGPNLCTERSLPLDCSNGAHLRRAASLRTERSLFCSPGGSAASSASDSTLWEVMAWAP